MKESFREHHLLELLDQYQQTNLPIDLAICQYFRAHKALGSKDRGYIAETIYTLVRWQGLLEYLCTKPVCWDKRYACLNTPAFEEAKKNEAIPLHTRLSFPAFLFTCIANTYGEEKAIEICLATNQAAPTTVRINAAKTTRDEMLQKWQTEYDVSPCQYSHNGIVFHKKINFFSLPEFNAGLFEVQDEGSQLLAAMMQVQPKELVLDYCSGSGGKTLAFAPAMQGQGQIYLHDIRAHALQEARKRLRRANIQNAQVLPSTDLAKLKKLKKKMDWVLVDSPCSGTGTMRRNPDMKWKFDEEMLKRLISQQRVIFEKALSFMKPDGRIVYATCSILKEENDMQVEHFIKTYGLMIEGEPFRSLPVDGGMDGFFGVVLRVAK